MSSELNPDLLTTIFPREDVDEQFRDRLIEILQHDPQFPSFPAAVAKLQEVLNHPHTGLEEIAQLVRMDPALTARLFALVRSVAYGGVKVSSIEEGLFRLGLKETRAAILAAKVLTRFSHLKVKLDWQRFWVHSLLTARLSQMVVDVFQPLSDKAYVAGLLHDAGKLVIAHYFPDQFDNIILNIRQTGCEMHEAERRILGTDHAAVGAAICHRWRLDEEIMYAVLYHHEPKQRTKYHFMAKAVYLADLAANIGEDNIHTQKKELPDPINEVNQLPEWDVFQEFRPRKLAVIQIDKECIRTRDAVSALQLNSL